MRKIKKHNPSLLELLDELKEASRKNDAPIWRDVARRLEASRRNWAAVNVGKISRFLGENEVALVPGKVLGDGDLDRDIEIAAFSFSSSAREKISKAGGKALTIPELMTSNPKGSGVRIFK